MNQEREAIARLRAALDDADNLDSIGVMVKSADLRALTTLSASRTALDTTDTDTVRVPRVPSEAMIEAARLADPLGYSDVPDDDVARLYSTIWSAMIAATQGEE